MFLQEVIRKSTPIRLRSILLDSGGISYKS
jgi:hypothetical protein